MIALQLVQPVFQLSALQSNVVCALSSDRDFCPRPVLTSVEMCRI